MKGIICQGDSATDAGKPDVLIVVKRSNRTIEERTCTKSHKGREAETGRVRSLIVLGMLGVLAAAFYGVVTGYCLEFQGRVVAKRVALYQDWEGMLDPAAKVVGYVEPGTKCGLFQAGAKSIPNFRVKCGDMIAWTAQGYSFDPPMSL